MLKKTNLNKIFSSIVFCICLTVLGPVMAQEAAEKKVQEEADDPYTWPDFLTNQDCRPFIKRLAGQSDYNKLYQNLKNFCLTEKPSAWSDLLNTFRKEKRKLLFNQTMNENTSYTKYLKVVPHLLFDIQNTKPTGNQPSAILDKAEQAIIDRQIDTALSLIKELPDAWQNELKNTQVLCKQLLEIEEQLYDLEFADDEEELDD